MSLELKCGLRALPGTGFGLRQKIMIGTITMNNELSPLLDQIINAAMEASTKSFYRPESEDTRDAVSTMKFVIRI